MHNRYGINRLKCLKFVFDYPTELLMSAEKLQQMCNPVSPLKLSLCGGAVLNSLSQCCGLSSQNPRDTFGAKNVCSKCTRSSLFGPSRVYAVMLVVFPKKQTPNIPQFPERHANASLIKEIKYQKVKPIEKISSLVCHPSHPFPFPFLPSQYPICFVPFVMRLRPITMRE